MMLTSSLQVRRAAQRTVSLLNDEAHAEAAFDAALLTPSHPAAGFDCWWRVEVPEPAALKLPGSLLEQPLLRYRRIFCHFTMLALTPRCSVRAAACRGLRCGQQHRQLQRLLPARERSFTWGGSGVRACSTHYDSKAVP